MMAHRRPYNYDNPLFGDNVCTHVIELLKRNPHPGDNHSVHLDICCGFGRIAEPLSLETGLHYIGVDGNEEGLLSLAERGFETHSLRLVDEQQTFEELKLILGDRIPASISFIAGLEHLVNGPSILRGIVRIAREYGAYVGISVPNVAHLDLSAKLAFGTLDYDGAGLLDHTHLRFFDNRLLENTLAQAGLHIIDSYDVEALKSDQCFPEDHPALAGGTLLRNFLFELRSPVDPFLNTVQFVKLCLTGPPVGLRTYVIEREPKRPFLSVVVRTRGNRTHTFVEVFTCLAGQTDTDFEVLVLGHKLDRESQLVVERAIDDSPQWLREKTRLILVNKGNRTHPLNVGFEAARGRYIAILDDDDIPMAHWVETFHDLDSREPGRVLRATTVRQDVKTINVLGLPGLRAEGPLEMIYPSGFDMVEHLVENHTPPVSMAFPRGAFHDLKIRFDEKLTTTEDWDFLMRVAAVAGVVSSPEITSVYRWWTCDECSRTEHDEAEWRDNQEKIRRKMDDIFFLYPKGTTRRIRQLIETVGALHAELSKKPVKWWDRYDAAYYVWKNHKKGLLGRQEALERMIGAFDLETFFLLYPLYKAVKPLRKLKRSLVRKLLGTVVQ